MQRKQENWLVNVCAVLVLILAFAGIVIVVTLIGTGITMGAWNYGVRSIWHVRPITFWPAFWIWMGIGVVGSAFKNYTKGD